MKKVCVFLAMAVSLGTTAMDIPFGPSPAFMDVPPVFIVQPSDETAVVNNVASFVVEAIEGAIDYQWEKSTDGGKTWTDLTGETNQVLFFAHVQDTDAGKYACVANNGGECPGVTSDVVTLTVLPSAPPKAEMKLSHTPGSHDVGMVFNANANLIESVVKSPGSLPGGSSFASVTAVRLEFKDGLGSKFIEVLTPGGLPANTDSGSFTFNGSNATDGEDPVTGFDLLGWQGETRLFFKVSGGLVPLAINVNAVDATLGSALSISGDYYTCPQLN